MKTLVTVALLTLTPLLVQQLDSTEHVTARNRQYVTYLGKQEFIPAGKRTMLDLHFRVQDGFHINSHTPRSELLDPTLIDFEPLTGVKAAEAIFPSGSTYSFDFDPKEKLDVYQGAFDVQLPVVATAGEHEIHGTLRYQACDHAACYPPRSLPFVLGFSAR